MCDFFVYNKFALQTGFHILSSQFCAKSSAPNPLLSWNCFQRGQHYHLSLHAWPLCDFIHIFVATAALYLNSCSEQPYPFLRNFGLKLPMHCVVFASILCGIMIMKAASSVIIYENKIVQPCKSENLQSLHLPWPLFALSGPPPRCLLYPAHALHCHSRVNCHVRQWWYFLLS